ncbi:hypothetical protein PoB_006172600 [Plakobranchus ocellatus]|uniref:Uncharacterized protein n=1 Tax=Plakobranchus ocellatus TaxID=259542 RepID=A0AAV4CU39_9GAST|nr:hypothetical protein PoB_006172600 [Plakobranchus ocellatus]
MTFERYYQGNGDNLWFVPTTHLPSKMATCGSMMQPPGASDYLGDLKLSGPPSGQGAGGEARTRIRRVPADLRADSLATVPPAPPSPSFPMLGLTWTLFTSYRMWRPKKELEISSYIYFFP